MNTDYRKIKRLDPSRQDNTILQFVSIYLLILAFFILLVTISTIDQKKSNAVMESLQLREELSDSDRGADSPGQAFIQKLNDLFLKVVGVEKIEELKAGKILRVQMGAEALFDNDRATIKATQRDLIDGIISALSSRPPGFQFDMEFVMGSSIGPKGNLPVNQTLAMARAGAFVRQLLGRGAPPDSISIGLGAIEDGEIAFEFYVRSPADAKKFYARLLGPIKKEN